MEREAPFFLLDASCLLWYLKEESSIDFTNHKWNYDFQLLWAFLEASLKRLGRSWEDRFGNL